MNRKPDTAPRFAVNRADMLSRLPGVQLPANATRFARGKPKLAASDTASSAPASWQERVFPLPLSVRRVR